MELYQLKAFIAVAQENSLTKAADRLYVSVPAASAQIKALEEELGVQLFERTSRGMFVTAAGRKLLTEAEQTLMAAGRVKLVAAEERGQISADLRVGTLSDSVPLRVGDALLALGLRHPNISITLHQAVSGAVVERVCNGDLDGGFTLADASTSGLSIDRLTEIDLVVALPPRFTRKANELKLVDLARLPWIVSVPECALHAAALDLFRDAGHVPDARYIADSDGVLRSMICSGLGAGILRLSEADVGVQSGELEIWPHWRGKSWLSWIQSATNSSPAISVLRQAVIGSWQSSLIDVSDSEGQAATQRTYATAKSCTDKP
ncbi:LysR family transcriptional regulator [Burkholderia multivorans]|uniref:LysR family transcriptional regulator n=1 Tax=Burkholderia multivorans TaxID=87883 RepID=UPI001588C60E|nr:LysR family transcriptional regulator [Burkholderia multivorans]